MNISRIPSETEQCTLVGTKRGGVEMKTAVSHAMPGHGMGNE